MRTFAFVYSPAVRRQLRKLDTAVSRKIVRWVDGNLEQLAADPRALGKPLSGNLRGLWRYRVGDYRIICQIHDDVLEIVAVTIEHRSSVYRA